MPGEKHPRPGMLLPVLVDPDDPEKISIYWDAILSADEQFARMPIPGPPQGPEASVDPTG